jgi:hypothetical protein
VQGCSYVPAPDIYDAQPVVSETYAGVHPCAYICVHILWWLPLAIPTYVNTVSAWL